MRGGRGWALAAVWASAPGGRGGGRGPGETGQPCSCVPACQTDRRMGGVRVRPDWAFCHSGGRPTPAPAPAQTRNPSSSHLCGANGTCGAAQRPAIERPQVPYAAKDRLREEASCPAVRSNAQQLDSRAPPQHDLGRGRGRCDKLPAAQVLHGSGLASPVDPSRLGGRHGGGPAGRHGAQGRRLLHARGRHRRSSPAARAGVVRLWACFHTGCWCYRLVFLPADAAALCSVCGVGGSSSSVHAPYSGFSSMRAAPAHEQASSAQ